MICSVVHFFDFDILEKISVSEQYLCQSYLAVYLLLGPSHQSFLAVWLLLGPYHPAYLHLQLSLPDYMAW